jgi:hypothetical protein
VRVRVCPLSSSIGNCWMDNLRLGGALRWKVETASWDGWEVVRGKADTFKVVAPACVD